MFGVQVFNMDSLTALLQKELRPSDVGNLGRIILPKVSLRVWDKSVNRMLVVSHLCRFHYGAGFLWNRPELRIFLLVSQKEAEMHLPFLAVREGISLQMEDFDTGVCWSIRYRWVHLLLNFNSVK